MKKMTLNSPSTPQGTLPRDLLLEIFYRLPVKSLLQFRCVSKSWLSLIRDESHRKKLPPAMLGLLNKGDIKKFIGLKSRTYIDPLSADTALSFIPSSQSSARLFIADCCNGLLLLGDHNFNPLRLYICNPATRMFAQITLPPPSDYSDLAFSLLFDPSRGSDYKIIFFARNLLPLYHLFSSKTGEWSVLKQLDLYYLQFGPSNSDSVFSDGILYIAIPWSGFVLAMDVERNLCTKKVIPMTGPFRYQCTGLCGGRLHLAVTVDQHLYIFVLEGDEFVLKHESSLVDVFEKFAGSGGSYFVPHCLMVIAFHQDLDLVFLKLRENFIISYHLVNMKAEEFVKGYNCSNSSWVAYTPYYSEDVDLLKNTTCEAV